MLLRLGKKIPDERTKAKICSDMIGLRHHVIKGFGISMLLSNKISIIRRSQIQFLLLLSVALIGCVTSGSDPDAERLSTQRAIVVNYLNRGLPLRALHELRAMLVQYPDNADLLGLNGLAHLALSNPEDATASLKRAYDLKPSLTTGLNLSSAYLESGKFREAMQLLFAVRKNREEMASYSYPERVHHNLGLALERQKKPKTAEKYYRAALKQNPNFYLSLMQLAGIQSRDGKSKSAIELYRRAQQSCSSCYDPVEAQAISFIKLNQPAFGRKLVEGYLRRKDIDSESRQRGEILLRRFAGNTLSPVR
jgi:Tfp pilus assembly protein PilF